MHNALTFFSVSTVRNEDSFEQHEERSDDCVVSGEVSERFGADERTVSGMKCTQVSEMFSCFSDKSFFFCQLCSSFLNSNVITIACQGSLVTKLILSMTRMINGRRISNWTRPVAGLWDIMNNQLTSRPS